MSECPTTAVVPLKPTVHHTCAAQTRDADRRTAELLRRELRLPPVATSPVGPFEVADATRAEVVDRLVAAFHLRRPYTAFALHVGGLLERRDRSFVGAMAEADLVYADGVSIVRLAALAGASRIERAATTDIGGDLLKRLCDDGQRPRVALVGGPQGLTERAAAGLSKRYDIDVVLTTHGYHLTWDGALAELRELGPDLVVVGLGAPREMRWVQAHRACLGDALVLTCGGWFGFLAGEEGRAPVLLQRAGLEWVWRWAQQPRRLARRYAVGGLVCLRLAIGLRTRRLVGRLSDRGSTATP